MTRRLAAKGTGPKKDRRHAGRRSTLLKWIVVAAALGLVVYGISQMSNVAYTDRDIQAVDFSDLSRNERNTALKAANQARCPCGCGMTLAQCVATDSTCPLRDDNIQKIRRMVELAKDPRPRS